MRLFLCTLALALFGQGNAPHQPTLATSPTMLPPPPKILISALHYWGYESYDDEAVQLANPNTVAVTLTNTWSLVDELGNEFVFPQAGYTLPPNARVWVANNAAAFARQFGFAPAFSNNGLKFYNEHGWVQLRQTITQTEDTVNQTTGWAAGKNTPTRVSMERINAALPDTPTNWASANNLAPIAFAANGQPITGTPKAQNSVAVPSTIANQVVINEIAWSGTSSNANDEWIELFNNSAVSVSLAGWQLGVGSTDIKLSGVVAPFGYFVLARNATVISPANLIDQVASFTLANTGAKLTLTRADTTVVDTLVYGTGSPQTGWQGAPLQPYTATQIVPSEGQILMRRLSLPDTDTAQDWLNDKSNLVENRKPIFPGWAYEQFYEPAHANASIKLVVAPDASFDAVAQLFASATTSIDLESFVFDNAALAQVLAAKSHSGVRVRLLLDGAPVGGFTEQMKWVCAQIDNALNNSGCWFMRSDDAQKIHTRYAYLHAKFAVVDNRTLLIGSENFGMNGMPNDAKTDGTFGQRGVLAVVESPELVARANAIFAEDANEAHRDIVRWCASCVLGAPLSGFQPITESGGTTYTVRFAPLQTTPVTLTLATSPESHVRGTDSILERINQAGSGDEILVEQLNEPTYWGASTSNANDDPNVRLFAIYQAAQRGAKVRFALDVFYNDTTGVRSNSATISQTLALARANGWNMQAVVANPTGKGIHNKMILVKTGNRYFSQIGSWNGTETSAKRDREMSLLIESKQAFDYLRGVFYNDFWLGQPIHLPVLFNNYATKIITYPLISEVMFNPTGQTEVGREWIEIYNPSPDLINLQNYKIGDAAVPGGFGDGMYVFPAYGLPAKAVIVIAENALLFKQDTGVTPDFELGNYDPTVPDLLPYAAWGSNTMSLNNTGDEVVLLSPTDQPVDALVWGTGASAGTLPYTQTLSLGGHTLQRFPADADANDCAKDFREQNFPSTRLVP